MRHLWRPNYKQKYLQLLIVTVANLFSVVFISERMQCESRDLENPSTVHVTVSTGQVTV